MSVAYLFRRRNGRASVDLFGRRLPDPQLEGHGWTARIRVDWFQGYPSPIRAHAQGLGRERANYGNVSPLSQIRVYF